MKTLFFVLACSLFFGIYTNVNAQCSGCNSHEELSTLLSQKTYIKSEQIAFYNSKIYVKLDEDVFIVPAIYNDQNGFFIQNARQNRCPAGEWKCPKCGRCNDFEYDYCPVCGTEMPE